MSKENGTGAELRFNKGDTINGFKIDEKIDEGGFGQVFKVSKDNKTYAMKVESNSQEGGSAIKLEMDVLTSLIGSNVFPQLVRAAKRPRYHYLVLELLGDNLRVLKGKSDGGVFTSGTWSRVGMQCLYAVKVLHDKGFLHRDVKPSNFAIAQNSGPASRRIVLFDFGLARRYIKLDNTRKKAVQKATKVSKENEQMGKKKGSKKPITQNVVAKKAGSKQQKGNDGKGGKKVKGKKEMSMEATCEEEPVTVNVKTSREMAEPAKPSKMMSVMEAPKEMPTSPYVFRIARPRTDFRGTYQYASPNAHRLWELGRHDDIWSLLYMTAEGFLELPWANDDDVQKKKTDSTLGRIFLGDGDDKQQPKRLTDDMEKELEKIQKMLEECHYYSFPEYDIVYKFLESVMKREKVEWADPYDWEKAQYKEEELKKLVTEMAKQKNPWENATKFFQKNPWEAVKVPILASEKSTMSKRPVDDDGRSRYMEEPTVNTKRVPSIEVTEDEEQKTIGKSVIGGGKKSSLPQTPTLSCTPSKDLTPSKDATEEVTEDKPSQFAKNKKKKTSTEG